MECQRYWYLSFVMVGTDGMPSYGGLTINTHPFAWLKQVQVKNPNNNYVIWFYKEIEKIEFDLAKEVAKDVNEELGRN